MRRMMVGESLAGDGNEVAHIDLMIGPKNGPVGKAFARCLARQTSGHNALLAVLAPNVPAKPSTVMFNKVTIKDAAQAVQMFGPAQAAVAKAVADSVAEGVIPKRDVEDLVVVVGVFVHWGATDNKKIYDFNYRATKEAIKRAMAEQPSMDEILVQKDRAKHPFFAGPGPKELVKAAPAPAPKPSAGRPPTRKEPTSNQGLSTAVVIAGILVAYLSALADQLGLGQSPGVGFKQAFGIIIGLLIMLVGYRWGRNLRASS